MTAITSLKLALAIILSAGTVSKAFAATETSTQQSYNVLFISVDDLNDWVGFLGGHPQVKTPNMDRLSKRSVIFERAYCAASVCNPSRGALMTGISPATSGVYVNGQNFRNSPVLRDAETIPQYFHKFGYFTTASGKIFHYPEGPLADVESWEEWVPQTGNPMSDHPLRTETQGAGGLPFPSAKAKTFDWGPLDIDVSETRDFQTAQWAGEALQKDYDRPFFLACGILKPHLPFFVPRKYFDLYPLDEVIIPEIDENDYLDLPPMGRARADGSNPDGDYQRLKRNSKLKDIVQAYLAAITYADDCVGEVLDALEKSTYRDNTIVVLWGDHGWHFGEKLRYRKATLWDRAARTTLLIRVPGLTDQGGVSPRTVNLLDLYPTLVDLCGLPPKKQLEGRSLVPLLKNPTAAWPYASLTTMKRNNHSLRTERWRYIRHSDGGEELYDHDVDSGEKNNLATLPEYEEVLVKLRQQLPQTNALDVRKGSELMDLSQSVVDPSESMNKMDEDE